MSGAGPSGLPQSVGLSAVAASAERRLMAARQTCCVCRAVYGQTARKKDTEGYLCGGGPWRAWRAWRQSPPAFYILPPSRVRERRRASDSAGGEKAEREKKRKRKEKKKAQQGAKRSSQPVQRMTMIRLLPFWRCFLLAWGARREPRRRERAGGRRRGLGYTSSWRGVAWCSVVQPTLRLGPPRAWYVDRKRVGNGRRRSAIGGRTETGAGGSHFRAECWACVLGLTVVSHPWYFSWYLRSLRMPCS